MIGLLALVLACGGAPSPEEAPATATAPSTVTAQPEAAAHPKDIGVSTLKERMDAGGMFVLDVRTAQEFASGHVPGAVNIDVQDLQGRLSELQAHKDQDFAVICAVGGRSAAAVSLLRSNGFPGATNVAGGTRAWAQAGYPLE